MGWWERYAGSTWGYGTSMGKDVLAYTAMLLPLIILVRGCNRKYKNQGIPKTVFNKKKGNPKVCNVTYWTRSNKFLGELASVAPVAQLLLTGLPLWLVFFAMKLYKCYRKRTYGEVSTKEISPTLEKV